MLASKKLGRKHELSQSNPLPYEVCTICIAFPAQNTNRTCIPYIENLRRFFLRKAVDLLLTRAFTCADKSPRYANLVRIGLTNSRLKYCFSYIRLVKACKFLFLSFSGHLAMRVSPLRTGSVLDKMTIAPDGLSQLAHVVCRTHNGFYGFDLAFDNGF